MNIRAVTPRILLVSQWPNVKNGEYELIEKIKQTGYQITVVDYLGFQVGSGECLNVAGLNTKYDFAISLHYDTPKFLNVPTYLWVANPLEFMHLRGDYRNVLMHHLRSYDGYLFNGASMLKAHIRQIVGHGWQDSELEMYPSCARNAMIPPKSLDQLASGAAKKVFYCGVNWERGADRAGRAQGLLDILQARQVADFYGPNKLEGISPWEGFSSYKGEIPFDGVSMGHVMRQYGAVLAVSSPAHMKSRTSSSRVFEGVAAGVPVISDENEHVREHFGDLVYYFNGDSEAEKAQSIVAALERINSHPAEAQSRVRAAQALMASRYCFEPCFEHVKAVLKSDCCELQVSVDSPRLDVFLFHHDADPEAAGSCWAFDNTEHVIGAAAHVAASFGVQVRIICLDCNAAVPSSLPAGVTWVQCWPEVDMKWGSLRLGEKVAFLAKKSDADFACFLTQFDFPQYDGFSVAIRWFNANQAPATGAIHVAGFFINDLKKPAPTGTANILRNNLPVPMYRWTQDSLGEHQMGTLCFNRAAMPLLAYDLVARLDVTLPVGIVAGAIASGMKIHRSRHMLMRVEYSHFYRHYAAYLKATSKGFWAQHYELVTNYNHELNALYDTYHESAQAIALIDRVAGHDQTASLVDPAVHAVNQFIGRLRPFYRLLKRIRNACRLGVQ